LLAATSTNPRPATPQIGSNFSSSFVTGDTMKIVLLGTSIKIYRNGAQVLSGTSSSNQTQQNQGLWIEPGGTAARFTNFSVACAR
jgi:hypothetical protein